MDIDKRKMTDSFRKRTDINGNIIIFINDIIFKGKRNVDWNDVETYVKKYIGMVFEVAETKDIVYIAKDFPDEFAGSKDTRGLRGGAAKAKANISQAVPEMIELATNKRFKVNKNPKHNIDAKYGWYRYDTRVAIPVFTDSGNVERYNVFHMEMLIRHAEDDNLYLYDFINIKKETSNPPKP
ncbi:MAG: hypothetical protein PHW34_13910 [Hespellia sp.]|nr:hypothetical protein [Hespellia sp.]